MDLSGVRIPRAYFRHRDFIDGVMDYFAVLADYDPVLLISRDRTCAEDSVSVYVVPESDKKVSIDVQEKKILVWD